MVYLGDHENRVNQQGVDDRFRDFFFAFYDKENSEIGRHQKESEPQHLNNNSTRQKRKSPGIHESGFPFYLGKLIGTFGSEWPSF